MTPLCFIVFYLCLCQFLVIRFTTIHVTSFYFTSLHNLTHTGVLSFLKFLNSLHNLPSPMVKFIVPVLSE